MNSLPRQSLPQPKFLPMTRSEMRTLGWDELDILLVTGDAYLDHPVHGVALLGRWLVAHGFRTGIVAQPRWDSPADILAMGRPRLFAGVSAGALDSMLAHYTAFRKLRHDDGYTPGGKEGKRPNRACIVYTNLVRQAFPGLPVVLGGIEASLRRAVHYDFWVDKLRRPLLLDAKADLLLYGMGEHPILQVAEFLDTGGKLGQPGGRAALPGAVFCGARSEIPAGAKVIELPSLEAMEAEPKLLMPATLELEAQMHDGGSWAVQTCGSRTVLFAPPAAPLATAEMDAVYGLPFAGTAHPSYQEPVPAEEMIRFSVTSHRGCGGACTFCSLALHQGRRCSSRSEESVLREVSALTRRPGWRGAVSDIGGPTANMWGAVCTATHPCRRRSCLFPSICPHFAVDQQRHIAMLRKALRVPGVSHVRVASGMRYDLGLKDRAYLGAFVREFVGGQLKVAPEHLCDQVLNLMRKPGMPAFLEFLSLFEEECRRAGKEQYVLPYLISAFPGCSDDDMRAMSRWLREHHWSPQQVQCFIPTPGTVATAMYYAGIDPDGKPIPVARTDAERLRQHGLIVPTAGHGMPPGASTRGKGSATKPLARPSRQPKGSGGLRV
jgi:uncharacterized radical SAM protein YgiQ